MSAAATPPDWDRPRPVKSIPWKMLFRVVRWSTYAAGGITLIMVLHKSPAPAVETNPQAAARVEQKFQDVEQALSNGQPATMRMDQTELNSYLASHLDIASNPNASNRTAAGSGTAVAPAATPVASTNEPSAAGPSSSGGPDLSAPTGTSPEEIEQVRSSVKDVKVELVGDHVRAYVVFNFHGKDMTLQLEGKLGAEDGYLHFEPIAGQIGALPIPKASLEAAVARMMESPENREKLKLPDDMSGLKIENGEVVATYK